MAETTTLTLMEFLLARIREDEAATHHPWNLVPHTVDCGVRLGYWAETDCVCGYPARILAECEVKRRIVVEHAVAETSRSRIEGGGPFYSCETCEPFPPAEHPDPGPCLTLRLLALPYADHPDYREEWPK